MTVKFIFSTPAHPEAPVVATGVVSGDCNSIQFNNSATPYRRVGSARKAIAAAAIRPWLNSSFQNLRARGAFLISGSLSESGVVGPLTIHSEKGRAFSFLNPWPSSGTPIVMQNGSQVIVRRVPPSSDVHLQIGEELYCFETVVDGQYEVTRPDHLAWI